MQDTEHSEQESGPPARFTRLRQRGGDATRRFRRWLAGFRLPTKLLVLTILFVMLAEILIFVPSIANFRVNWLTMRLTSARLAALAADSGPQGLMPAEVRRELLNSAQVRAVAIKRDNFRRLIMASDMPPAIDQSFDLRPIQSGDAWTKVGAFGGLVVDALQVFVSPSDRMIRVYGQAKAGLDQRQDVREFVEIVMPEEPLRKAMVQHGINVLILSIIISIITAAAVYLALHRVLVRPMMRITENMLHFSENPEDAARVIEPSGRRDEIGTAEDELARMQQELHQLLQQRRRLAELGLAVSKINHDLRNMLASAQLISDRLSELPDPTVQRFAPKLIASLDRAINFCNDTLRFGRAQEAAPRRELFVLDGLVNEVADGLNLPRDGVKLDVRIPSDLRVDADRDHLYRVLNNLCRNAAQAIEAQDDKSGTITITAHRAETRAIIDVFDDGPGVPPKARQNLFKAFQGGARKGGTGLGLAISAELIRAHGGDIQLLNTETGASFRIQIPDRQSA